MPRYKYTALAEGGEEIKGEVESISEAAARGMLLRRNLEVTESQVRSARLQVDTNRRGGSDQALAIAAMEQARANVGAAEARLAQCFIRAPADGVLIGRAVEPGNVVAPGRELLALAPDGETQIVVQLDERHLARLSTGQKGMASADAFPGTKFGAELFYINPGIDALRGTVEVKLRVKDRQAAGEGVLIVPFDITLDGKHHGELFDFIVMAKEPPAAAKP